MRSWEALLIHSDDSIEKAIDVLNRGTQKIALVVNEQRQLLGTVTDGDIRRAVLKHVSLHHPVAQIMCNTPKIAHEDWSRERMLFAMEKYQLLQLPVVDTQNQLVGLETLHDILKKPRRDNPVFLMAGGFGTRLHPLTKDCPKSLLKLGGKPILELILTRLIDNGFHRFFISTHYLSDKIKIYFGDGRQWGVNIQYIHEDRPLGTGGALGLLPHDELDLPIFVMNADLLTALDFQNVLEFHRYQESAATLCVRKYEHRVPFGVVKASHYQVIKLIEKPIYHAFINAGIYLLAPEIARGVQPNVRIDMPDVLQHCIDKGYSVSMFPIHEHWIDIGQIDDFRQAELEMSL